MRKNHLYSAANTWWHQIHHMCSSGRCKIHRIWRSSSAWSKGNRRNCNCHTRRVSQKISGLSNWFLSSRQPQEFQSSHTEGTWRKVSWLYLFPYFNQWSLKDPLLTKHERCEVEFYIYLEQGLNSQYDQDQIPGRGPEWWDGKSRDPG